MSTLRTHPTLRTPHLTRPALVYVRPSTRMQVRANTASTARQYQLATRARDLGWAEPFMTLTKRERTMRLDVRGQTHACSTLEVVRLPRAWVIRRTPPEVVERVRQWAPHYTDLDIAERLNHAGYRSGQRGAFSASQVEWRRYAYGLKRGCPLEPAAIPKGQRGDHHDSARAAADLLNVSVSTIADGGKAGKLVGGRRNE